MARTSRRAGRRGLVLFPPAPLENERLPRMTDHAPRHASPPAAHGPPEQRHTRRRFLIGLGIGLSGMAIEAGSSAMRSALGPFFGGGGQASAAATRPLGSAFKHALAPPVIGVERLGAATVPARGPQPAQSASYRPDLRTRIGQMLLVGFRGTVVDASSPIVQDITQRSLGGVVLFDRTAGGTIRNIESPNQLANLTATLQAASRGALLGAPLIVAVDEEGGNVARLGPRNGFPGTYTAATLGQRNDLGFTEAQGAAMAATLAGAGINLNLAPVVDLNLNAANRIIAGSGRSFSGDAGIAAAHAAAFIRGHARMGVRTVVKHFPGQGSAAGDTHLGIVDVSGRWTAYELEPFKSLLADGLVDAVMTAHIYNAGLDASYPATLSAATVSGLLREQLGYDGVVISDDLNMGAIRAQYRYEDAVALAIRAGVDILTIADQTATGLVGRTIDVIEGLVTSGAIPESRIDASYGRIAALKSRLLGA